ncbi:hypothetical protein CRYUN_Cryun13aG0104100 [Craigia yunnanensis]
MEDKGGRWLIQGFGSSYRACKKGLARNKRPNFRIGFESVDVSEERAWNMGANDPRKAIHCIKFSFPENIRVRGLGKLKI